MSFIFKCKTKQNVNLFPYLCLYFLAFTVVAWMNFYPTPLYLSAIPLTMQSCRIYCCIMHSFYFFLIFSFSFVSFSFWRAQTVFPFCHMVERKKIFWSLNIYKGKTKCSGTCLWIYFLFNLFPKISLSIPCNKCFP